MHTHTDMHTHRPDTQTQPQTHRPGTHTHMLTDTATNIQPQTHRPDTQTHTCTQTHLLKIVTVLIWELRWVDGTDVVVDRHKAAVLACKHDIPRVASVVPNQWEAVTNSGQGKTTKQEHHWRVAVSSAPADTRRFHAYTVSHKPVVAQHVQQQQCGQFLESCVAAIIKDTRLLPK